MHIKLLLLVLYRGASAWACMRFFFVFPSLPFFFNWSNFRFYVFFISRRKKNLNLNTSWFKLLLVNCEGSTALCCVRNGLGLTTSTGTWNRRSASRWVSAWAEASFSERFTFASFIVFRPINCVFSFILFCLCITNHFNVLPRLTQIPFRTDGSRAEWNAF